MNQRIVLIITNQQEQEVDGVIDFLRVRDVNIKRWNLCQFPENEYYTVSPFSLLFPMFQITDKPTVCWLHHFGQFSIEKTLTGLEREVALKESKNFVEGVLSSLNCSWLNQPINVIRASNKLFQLQLAQELNIPFPDYIISNDQDQVKKFISNKKSVVVKSIVTGFICYGEKNLKIYTRQFSELPSDLLSALKFSPVIVQQTIEKKKEFRITVVGDQCFSIEIDYSELPTVTDVRELINENNRNYFKRAESIEEIENISIRLTKKLGLTYAGIDWLQSKDGKYHFLELNPLGSFKWYEQCGNFNITETIGNKLLARLNDGKS